MNAKYHAAYTQRTSVGQRQRDEERSEQIERLIHESYTLVLRAQSAKADHDQALTDLETVLAQLERFLDAAEGSLRGSRETR